MRSAADFTLSQPSPDPAMPGSGPSSFDQQGIRAVVDAPARNEFSQQIPIDSVFWRLPSSGALAIRGAKPRSGVNLVTLLSSLTFDSDTNQYLAVVNIKNSGSVTATGLTVTGALDGANAVSVVPAGVSSLSMGTSFSVTLAFPSSVGAPGGRGVLTIHEDYDGGTAGGGFLVTFP